MLRSRKQLLRHAFACIDCTVHEADEVCAGVFACKQQAAIEFALRSVFEKRRVLTSLASGVAGLGVRMVGPEEAGANIRRRRCGPRSRPLD